MVVQPAEILGLSLGLSELLLLVFKRSRRGAVSKDRGSLGLIWAVYLTSIFLGIVAAYRLHGCAVPWPAACQEVGFALFVLGLAFRWYAILCLGRFFTANVAIADGHHVVDSGPYRYIRHPSYAGGLLALLGLSLSFQNWASGLIIFVPCFAVNRWRIYVEEKALLAALGEPYRAYMRRTKRLIPLIY